MMDIYKCLRPALMAIEPERAHRMTLGLLKAGLGSKMRIEDTCLRQKIWGRDFANPLGLAAGFDKDAEVMAPLFDMGFGFVEAGTVTPLPQAGNPAPRMFRDVANKSVINRLGFPGKGLDYFLERISHFRVRHAAHAGMLGVNIGINKETQSPFEDYSRGITTLAPFADYIAVNVSSPNTPGLRDLQSENMLDALLAGLVAVRNALDLPLATRPPLLLKVAPDLDAGQKEAVAMLALRHHLDGLIVANTTISRPAALAPHLQQETGGLSGRLLTALACDTLRDFYRLTGGRVPLIGVGGISSADDAWQRIRAGASLVQVYTGLIYEGPALVSGILNGLIQRVRDAGMTSISEAVGMDAHTDAQTWEKTA